MSDAPFIPLRFQRLPESEMRKRADAFFGTADRRRSVRSFSEDAVPLDVVETCIRSAGTAPSGAHKQPWTFALITDPAIKTKIREAAEEEERENYGRRMNEEWLDDLRPFKTDAEKAFLELAPALIVLFRHAWEIQEDGERGQNYYTQESVGIAAGMLLAALNDAGLATLTHTPSPMGFLGKLLGRPENEKAFLLIPIGYPSENCEVPGLQRKSVDDIVARY
ncbi:MAG: iodotyrosine deiodinase [Planctomycetota bacterium]|jgi:iodotyrosine deiodinase